MKLKQYFTLGLGVIVGFGVSIAGLSYATGKADEKISLITSQKARKIMLDKVPGGKIVEFSYDGDDRTPKYDGTLIKGNYEYEVDINAKTGAIIKFEKEKTIISNKPTTSNIITAEKAKDIMLSKVPGGKIVEFSYDGDDRTPKYDGTLIKDNYEYEIDVDAKTGKVIKLEKEVKFVSNNNGSSNNNTVVNNSNTQQNTQKPSSTQVSQNTQQNTTKPSYTQSNTNKNTNSYIGAAKAKSIMLSKVPGATVRSFYLDNDATPEYEGTLIKGDYEYDISVDARTGAITEFDKEYIEKYDYDDDQYDDYDDRYDYDDDRYDD